MAEFIFAIIVALIAVLAAIGVFIVSETGTVKALTVLGAFFVLVLSAGMIFQSMFQSVPTKSEGVLTSYGKVIGTPYGPGPHLVAPWRTVNIVADTIQSDKFSDENPNGADQFTASGIQGYCIKVRLAGLNQGCANVQLQTQVKPSAIPELYANYSSYGPNLTEDVDEAVVKRQLTTDLNRTLGDYNVIQDVSDNLTACLKNGANSCQSVKSSQFSQFDGAILTALQNDRQLSGITVFDVNLQNVVFPDVTETAIQDLQHSYLQTVEATIQQKTNAAISLANAALIKQSQSLTPAVLQYDCYQTIQQAIKANFNGLPSTFGCSGVSPNVLVNGK